MLSAHTRRIAAVVFAFSLALGVASGRAAYATPFSDVPANHWAYQALQSLAASGLVDGYPGGSFKGDRPLTRYEMAVVVARVAAKVADNPALASRSDLDKIQKLMDALKDELDGLGVRVGKLEDQFDDLDKRTKFAQGLTLHGDFRPQVSLGEGPINPHAITNDPANGTQNLYYGGAVAPGRSAAIDPLVLAYLQSGPDNDPIAGGQARRNVFVRSDGKFSLSYQINPNLTLTLPLHLLNYEYGSFAQQARYDVEPGVDVVVKQAGNLQNLNLRFGILDDLRPSRLGLAFNPPEGDQIPLYYDPYQPYPRGFSAGATLNGLTDMAFSFSRLEASYINTSANVVVPGYGAYGYFYPADPAPAGYTQSGPPGSAAGALASDTFTSGAGVLSEVFLTKKAVAGTVYISAYNGSTFGPNGAVVAQAPGGPAAPPAFMYNDTYNAVVFTTPVMAGSSVTVSYTGLAAASNNVFQRYMVNARINQKFKGYPGGELGFTFNRIYDWDGLNVTGDLAQAYQPAATGAGLVGDTVFGVDFEAPIPLALSGKGSFPVLFGELASSNFTPNFRSVAAVFDTAEAFGLRFKLSRVQLSAQYQRIGPNFVVGAPFQYYGPTPATAAEYRAGVPSAYFPAFFGFANTLGINQQFDQLVNRSGGTARSAADPNLTFIYPVFNPFRGSGPQYYSSFIPNTEGETLNATVPVNVAGTALTFRANYQHLQQFNPDAMSTSTFLPQVPSPVKARLESGTLGTSFAVPLAGQKLSLDLSTTIEELRRADMTAVTNYVPVNPGTGGPDATANAALASAAAAAAASNPSGVSIYPNFIALRHFVYAAAATMPLTANLNLSLGYNSQRFGGEYGTTLGQNISQRKDLYTGGLTYNIPKTNSSVGFVAAHYEYKDDALPSFNTIINQQNVNFSVRF
jgi:hypothetical protein